MKSEKDKLLERFMKEHFPYGEFKKAGIFTKGMRNDYKTQAQWVCNRLGLKSIYEYGSEEIRCHISYGSGVSGMSSAERPLHINKNGELKCEPFVTVTKSWLDE